MWIKLAIQRPDRISNGLYLKETRCSLLLQWEEVSGLNYRLKETIQIPDKYAIQRPDRILNGYKVMVKVSPYDEHFTVLVLHCKFGNLNGLNIRQKCSDLKWWYLDNNCILTAVTSVFSIR